MHFSSFNRLWYIRLWKRNVIIVVVTICDLDRLVLTTDSFTFCTSAKRTSLNCRIGKVVSSLKESLFSNLFTLAKSTGGRRLLATPNRLPGPPRWLPFSFPFHFFHPGVTFPTVITWPITSTLKINCQQKPHLCNKKRNYGIKNHKIIFLRKYSFKKLLIMLVIIKKYDFFRSIGDR